MPSVTSYQRQNISSVVNINRAIFCSKWVLTIFCFLSLATTVFSQKKQKPKEIMGTMKKVADWQLAHFEEQSKDGSKFKNSHAYWAWTNGALYAGMMAFAQKSKDETYFDFLLEIGRKEGFKPGPDIYHADDIAVGQTYLDLYAKYRDSAMIKPTLERMDFIITNRATGSLDFTIKGNQKRWSWCDALFMAPPAYAKAAKLTGDQIYLDFMVEEFKVTYDTLYDKTNHLFFRDTRYKTQQEANGQNIFWARGNGWVIGGLCRIIDALPESHPQKKWFIQLFTEMMERIAGLQDKDGFWHSSLLDPESYPMPETSSSGFFTYGLAWGINHGYLKKSTYKPIALKGWNALTSAVFPDGKLGWVQPIGADPKKVTKDMTEVYGVGAFLLAGCEMAALK